MGTADFTGTSSGSSPCGIGYVCSPPNGPEYYYFPSLFPTPASGSSNSKLLASIAATPTVYDAVSTSLSGVLLNPDLTVAQDSNGNDLRVSALTFNSDVQEINGEFHYIYSISNATNTAIQVNWNDAGINGDVPALGSLQNEIIYSQAPEIQSGTVSFTLNKLYSGGAVMYAPVPEPNNLVMLVIGILFLISVGHMNRSRKVTDGSNI